MTKEQYLRRLERELQAQKARVRGDIIKNVVRLLLNPLGLLWGIPKLLTDNAIKKAYIREIENVKNREETEEPNTNPAVVEK